MVHDHKPDDGQRRGKQRPHWPPHPGPKCQSQKNHKRIEREPSPDKGRGYQVAFQRRERDQAERTRRDVTAQANANENTKRDLDQRDPELTTREGTHNLTVANWNTNVEQREKDLETREKIAAKKLNDANKLMASYDEAKHQAALKLAS